VAEETTVNPTVRPGASDPSVDVLKIIIVDDDVTVLGLIEDVLRAEPALELEAFHDSEQALSRLREAQFDIMITDLKMPKVDGMALMRALRQIDTETLIIIITGFATMESCLEAMRCGAYDYLTKPFRMEEFLHVVRNSIERVRLVRRGHRLENELNFMKTELQQRRGESTSLRSRVSQLEEQNAVFQQLLQRAGVAGVAGARPSSPRVPVFNTYPRMMEKPADRRLREMDRLNQLERAGAISAEDAERARKKIQASAER
jgi:DNA-binding response OmpR family regulator